MREFLFRGKTSEELVYGSLFTPPTKKVFILSHDGKSGKIIWNEVVPETVTQYVGIEDTKGKKIFGGDIDSNGFEFVYDTHMGGWYRMKNGEGVQWHAQACSHGGKRLPFEIAGNRFENPELLNSPEKQDR